MYIKLKSYPNDCNHGYLPPNVYDYQHGGKLKHLCVQTCLACLAWPLCTRIISLSYGDQPVPLMARIIPHAQRLISQPYPKAFFIILNDTLLDPTLTMFFHHLNRLTLSIKTILTKKKSLKREISRVRHQKLPSLLLERNPQNQKKLPLWVIELQQMAS